MYSLEEMNTELTFWQYKQSIDQTPVIPCSSRGREHKRDPQVQPPQASIFEPFLMCIIRQYLQIFYRRAWFRHRLHDVLFSWPPKSQHDDG